MNRENLTSVLLERYLKSYELNPKSRVFAPLAETYRQMGMMDKALHVLKNGIAHHPDYILGYLGLAFCYFDLDQYNLSYTTLKPLMANNLDNIRLQKLFASVCLKLNAKDEALGTYKYLLFINPKDTEAKEWVLKLEQNSVLTNNKIEKRNSSEIFSVEEIDSSPVIDGWTQVDFGKDQLENATGKSEIHTDIEKDRSHEYDFEMKSLGVIQDNDKHEDDSEVESSGDSSPLITHTIVDLYCDQGHFNKAYEVLENMLKLNPTDGETIRRIDEVKQQIIARSEESFSSDVGVGHSNLMAQFDSISIDEEPEVENDSAIPTIETKLNAFLHAIRERAKSVKNHLDT